MDFKIVAHTPVGVFTSVVMKNISDVSHFNLVEAIKNLDKFMRFEDAHGNTVILKKGVLKNSVFTICKIKE